MPSYAGHPLRLAADVPAALARTPVCQWDGAFYYIFRRQVRPPPPEMLRGHAFDMAPPYAAWARDANITSPIRRHCCCH